MSIRIHRSDEAGWTKLANAVLRDPALTLRAKGLLAQLLSHDDGWQQSLAYAEKQAKDGRTSIRAAFLELEDAGYARKRKHRDETGRFHGWDYDVYDTPLDVRGISEVGETDIGVTEVGQADTLEDSPSSRTPSTEDTQELALAPTASSRPRDLIFEVLFVVDTGKAYTPTTAKVLTPSARSSLNKAAADIKATGISEDDLWRAIRAWPSVMDNATCTANAVAKHLPRLLAAADGNVARAAQPSDQEKVLAELRRRRELKEASGA